MLHSCLRCDRFICTDCWDDRRARCADCAPLVARATRARDLILLRRVDRRLREVMRDGGMLTYGHASAPSTTAAELACLRIKASNAAQNGERALVRRVKGARGGDVDAFARRIRRHTRLAGVAVARAERATEAARAEHATQAAHAERATEAAHTPDDVPRLPWLKQVMVGGFVGAAVALVVMVLTGNLDIGSSGRGGVLSGVPPDGSSAQRGSGDPTGPAGHAPEAQRVSLAFDFDEVRMGGGIGEAWGGDSSPTEAESIQVAAFPTSFDRSARLTATGGENVTVCAAVVPQVLQRIAFDVYLDPARPAVGTLSLYAAGDAPQLEIVIDAQGPMSASVPLGQDTPGPRIAAGAWDRVELMAEPGDLRWRVRSRAEPTTAPTDGSFGPATLAPITRICLGVDGPAGGEVSYDNLEIHGTTSGG